VSAKSEGDERSQDKWADWLQRGRRRGMTADAVSKLDRRMEQLRDRVLRGATLRRGQTVIDVGAGTGLLALAARRRVGRQGRVIAADVSFDALVVCRDQALRTTEDDDDAPLFCVVADANALPFATNSAHRVLTRSVLIYVEDKTTALREFHRVLRGRGLTRLFEPINKVGRRDAEVWPDDPSFEWVKQRQQTVGEYYRNLEGELRPMMDFDERDLAKITIAAGFDTVAFDYVYTFSRPPGATRSWSSRDRQERLAAGLEQRPNPHSLSYEEVARQLLGDEAQEYLDRYVEMVASRPYRIAQASVYLTAKKAP
jgi:ubiquinone/menaquinone biosynthesis C-methylase UbiE